jgi:hypothetical protein
MKEAKNVKSYNFKGLYIYKHKIFGLKIYF